MASAAHQIAAPPAAQPALPDELLEDIFLRLDAAADVARASAACTTFHRVVSARRFRSLHPPPVLGFLESGLPGPGAFHPADPPHRSAPAARALAQAADFSFSFLPDAKHWSVCDARDGRVLLYRFPSEAGAFKDIVVCDPLHRRYFQLPPIPDDLAASSGGRGFHEFEPFLDPAATDREREEQDLPFRVIRAVQCQHDLVTFHFSSVTGKWSGITFNWSAPLNFSMLIDYQLLERHYAHGCFCWTFLRSCRMVILDTRAVTLSIDNHLPVPKLNDHHRPQAIVEVVGGRLGVVNLYVGFLELYSKTLGNNGVDAEGWQLDKKIRLPQMDCFCSWGILGAAEGYLLLEATPNDNLSANRELHCFILDLKTSLAERLCVSNQKTIMGAHLYASFPPSLSLPSV